MQQKSNSIVIKPNKFVFIWVKLLYRLLTGLTSVAGTLLLAIFLGGGISLLIPLITFLVWVLDTLYFVVSRSIAFKKEEYQIGIEKIVHKSGGIFSDRETELQYKNVTFTSVRLPFLENAFFGTGSVMIQSAGSVGVEIYMQALDNPVALYEEIEERLQQNGFSLQKDNLIQKEKPVLVGLLIDTITFVAQSSISLVFLIPVLGNFIGSIEETQLQRALTLLAFLALIVFFLGAVVGLTLRFFDLKRRQYLVFQDSLVYDEGFLTKVKTTVPMENLADSYSEQNFWQRLLGIYDVRVSARGGGQELRFSNMSNGKQMEVNLDELINSAQVYNNDVSFAVKPAQVSPLATKEKPDKKSSLRELIAKRSNQSLSRAFSKTYRIDLLRTGFGLFFGAIFFIFFSVILLVIYPLSFVVVLIGFFLLASSAVTLAANIYANKFEVRAGSIRQSYSLFNRKVREFSLDKVTMVQIRKDLLDRFFGTVTIEFRSLGSNANIIFSKIRISKAEQQKLLEKFGMSSPTSPEKIYEPQFSFTQFFLAHVWLVLLYALFTLTIPTLAAVTLNSVFVGFFVIFALLIFASFLLIYQYLLYQTASLKIHKDYIAYEFGIIIRNYKYAPLLYIKDLMTIKYPFSSQGALVFNIAGDTIQIMEEGGQQQISYITNQIRLDYIKSISKEDNFIDSMLLVERTGAKVPIRDQVLAKYKPSLKNALFPSVIVALIFFPFLPFYLWNLILVKVTSYELQEQRIIMKTGIVYRSQKSILYSHFDYIDKSQGAVNKLFKNGNVSVYTEGSSAAEMSLLNVPEWLEAHQKLQDHYT